MSLFERGLDVRKIFWYFGREKCFSLDIPFYRTSRSSDRKGVFPSTNPLNSVHAELNE
jgi:hypothetical protein